MKKFFSLLVLISVLGFQFLNAQIYYGSDASKIVEGSQTVRITNKSSIPAYIKFYTEQGIDVNSIELFLKKTFKLSTDFSLQKTSSDKDLTDLGIIRYDEYFKSSIIHDAKLIVHIVDGKIQSMNGTLYSSINVLNNKKISEANALAKALEAFPADKYKWEIPGEELLLKEYTNNPSASYYPKAELVLFPNSYPDYNKNYIYTYKLSVYADKPLFKKNIYIDAESGKVVFAMDELHMSDVLATAVTKYSGNQEITSDSYNSVYRLRESGRGNGIETYDMNTGTSYNSSVDFTDTDNYWNNFNADFDEVATDAHWATEMTYDYYYYNHNRNSIDGNGFKLRNYVHYDFEYSNAFWDGTRMTFGDGSGSVTPFTACDIVGHEITHGLTSYTANLDYAYESGAINEGFSDIFGTSIEFYAKPADANWTMGEDIGYTMRSMSNPNLYNQADTYLGTYWYTGSDDNGGVHYNNSIMNHWYYLLSEGGSGTNDIGNSFNFSGIGIIDAGKIAFRTLTVYLTNSSQYADVRFYSIIAAIDLFGSCSTEVEAVTRAWYAVGIGPDYVNSVLSDFSGDFLEFCSAPANVQFTNLSVNGTSFIWNFGDGSTSTSFSPSHTYANIGTYTVSLFTDGGTCGSDTSTQVAYISIDPSNPCIVIMNETGALPQQNSCTGTVFDSGGQSNYQNSTNSTLTINPTSGLTVTLTFQSFSFEQDYDYLYVYDGPSTSSPLIGQYTGSSLPNGGTIQSTGSAITLRQTSDVYVTEEGFVATWQCDYSNTAPVTNFYADNTESCSGTIQFFDNSVNGPTSWLWDFGDGNTSTLQNPAHTYSGNGLYSVSLISSNAYGIDSISFLDYIFISSPSAPSVEGDTICEFESTELIANGFGAKTWFTEQYVGDLVAIGDSFTTPSLNSSTQYWVESYAFEDFIHAAKPDNSGGGGYFSSAYVHYLVFDCYAPTRLLSVKVYSSSAGNRLIRLNNSTGIMIASKNVFIPEGESRVYLNFDIPVGNDLQLAGPASPDLYRNNSGNNYPYDVSGLLSVKYSSASTDPTGYYYYFYDWEVMEETCESERIPALVNVMPLPQSNFTYIIDSGTVNFSNTSVSADSYTWDFGDGSSSNDENPTHIYGQSGNYTVSLVANNNCGTTSSSVTFTIILTGIDDINNSESNLSIYPNPNIGNFTIYFSSNEKGKIELEIFDILGQKLWNEIVDSYDNNYVKEIDIKSHSAGIYYLRISTNERIYNRKFIVE